MNVHKNARLTPRGRALMVSRIVDEGWSVVAAAEASGVSERTARKWLGRRRRAPNEGFTDRSSAPRRCPRRVAPRRITEIERLRRQRMSGPQPSDIALYDRIAMDRMRDEVPEQFTEAGFMRRYQVSRAQLVRTLTRLTHDGLVRRGNGHGWVFLAVLNSEDAYDASYRYRILIEPAGLLEPTFKLDETSLERSRRVHEQILILAEAGDLKGRDVFDINAEFHEMLASMSGNPFILQGVRQQNRLRRLSEYYAYDDSARIGNLVREHFEIMDALRSGDRDWAATLLRRHLEIARRLPPPFRKRRSWLGGE